METNIKLKGRRGSAGKATGPAVVLRSLDAAASLRVKMQRGSVLIAPLTNPSLVVYMRLASAIATDTGAYHSHAAKVARELGIPCVVGLGKATEVISDGATITVDGDAEEVIIHA
jgi:pyruvate,water dikinase